MKVQYSLKLRVTDSFPPITRLSDTRIVQSRIEAWMRTVIDS
jgi:hypothetical protein